MDRRITIQSAIVSKDPIYGHVETTWSDWATVWANVYGGGGREFEAARQITAEIDTQFHIRWVEGLTPTMRILYEDRIYDILRIQEVGRRHRCNIWAKARQE